MAGGTTLLELMSALRTLLSDEAVHQVFLNATLITM